MNGCPFGGKEAHTRERARAAAGDSPKEACRELEISDSHAPSVGEGSCAGPDLRRLKLPTAALTQAQRGQNVRKSAAGGLGVGLKPAPGLQHWCLAGAVPGKGLGEGLGQGLGQGLGKPGADRKDLLLAARGHLEMAMGLKVYPNGRARNAQERQSPAVR